MKKSGEILGLPIFSIKEGCQIGVAKRLVIDSAKGAVVAVAVEPAWYLPMKLLPFKDIFAIGVDAITVDSSAAVLTLDSIQEIIKILDDNVQIIGTKVMTKTGRILGNVIEIEVDDSGKIVSLALEGADGARKDFATAQVITFAKEVVIINDPEQGKNK